MKRKTLDRMPRNLSTQALAILTRAEVDQEDQTRTPRRVVILIIQPMAIHARAEDRTIRQDEAVEDQTIQGGAVGVARTTEATAVDLDPSNRPVVLTIRDQTRTSLITGVRPPRIAKRSQDGAKKVDRTTGGATVVDPNLINPAIQVNHHDVLTIEVRAMDLSMFKNQSAGVNRLV
jgi:hypothetical protein